MKIPIFKVLILGLLSIQTLIAQDAYEHSAQESRQTCSNCHDMKEGKEFFHKPVMGGSCNSCHNVFVTTKDLLRTDNILDICIMCHSDKRRVVEGNNNVHPPVKNNCTFCHDPHAGDHKFRLKADRKRDICLTCHTDKKEWIANSKNQHGAINLPNGGCIACHDPHATGQPQMIKAKMGTKEACLKCHDKSLKREEDGVMLLSIGEHLDNNQKWHGPIVVGECTGCHNPHGSNNHRMLKRPYPSSTNRMKFDKDKYLCFKCHQLEKVLTAKTTTETNFRKGTKNLHRVHVKDSSITCGTCHDFHGVQKQIPLVKNDTTFVGTRFKLRYEKVEFGGSCNPICHARRHYERSDQIPKR